MKPSEDDLILGHMQSGKTITPKDAFLLYGCLALHSAASRLRKDGHQITCVMRSGNGKRWGEYSLRGQLSLAA